MIVIKICLDSGRAKFKRGQGGGGAYCQYKGTYCVKFCYEGTKSVFVS